MKYFLYRDRQAEHPAPANEVVETVSGIGGVALLIGREGRMRTIPVEIQDEAALHALEAALPQGWKMEEDKPAPPPQHFEPQPF